MRSIVAFVAAGIVALIAAPGAAVPLPEGPVFAKAVALPGAAGGTEPRVAVDDHDVRWAISNSMRTAVVYRARGATGGWTKTPGNPAGQTAPTIDVDIVTTHTGRIIATELDFAGINFPTSYSDDGGATWTASKGTALADQDRQWLAVGPDDPSSHKPSVYLLYHNLFSGVATHNMFVMTSTDGGESFGPPVPTTLPGDQAWLDLQCSDSGGPSSISVNQTTGQIYVAFGTRSSAAGGCGAQPVEANIVAATRVWVATSPDGSIGSWKKSLPVDDSASGRIVGMQLAYGALDNKGNFYVAYPESPRPYPDYSGAAIRVKWAPPDLSKWSEPITLAPESGAGNLLPHIAVGDPGKIDVAYMAGRTRPNPRKPLWYATVAQTLNAFDSHPTVTQTQLSKLGAYAWTASEMMGACAGGPLGGIQSGFTCDRSTDVWGIALDKQCRLVVAWPAIKTDEADGAGTWMSTQTGGTTLCGAGSVARPAATANPKARTKVLGKRSKKTLPSTGLGDAPWALPMLSAAVIIRRLLRAAA